MKAHYWWYPGSHGFHVDLSLLLLRIGLGSMMLTHGIPKILSYAQKSQSFSDPFGLGSEFTLILAIFAEVVCAILIIFGLLTRISVIPLLVTMLTAALIVHGDDPFSNKEKALIYFIGLLPMLFAGAGRFSLDRVFFQDPSEEEPVP